MADQIKRVDDLDNSLEAAERIYFTIRGQDFQIDLTEEHAQEFDQALEKYVTAATKLQAQPAIPITRGRRRQSSGGIGRGDLAEIPAWAQAHGKDVSARGRIKQSIIDEYDEAHKS